MKGRHLVEEGLRIVGQPVHDFVDDVELALPDHIGLPQGQDGPTETLLIGHDFVRRLLDPIADLQDAGDLDLAVQHALAPYLCRMSGQNRADERLGEKVVKTGRVDPGLFAAEEHVR